MASKYYKDNNDEVVEGQASVGVGQELNSVAWIGFALFLEDQLSALVPGLKKTVCTDTTVAFVTVVNTGGGPNCHEPRSSAG